MINGRHVFFVTFGDTSLHKTLTRIYNEAIAMNLFDGIFVYDETKLDPQYFARHKEWFQHFKRGYGLWIWKPQVILQTMKQVPENSIILYTDTGCTLNAKAHGRLVEYINSVISHPTQRLIFQSRFYTEEQYTTQYVLERMQFTAPEQRHSKMCYAGVTMFAKTRQNIELLQRWDNIMHITDMLQGGRRLKPCSPRFVDHRQDQSILSILMKHNDALILEDEIEITDRPELADTFPIQATRLKY